MLWLATHFVEVSVIRQPHCPPGIHDSFAHFQSKPRTERVQLLFVISLDHQNVSVLLELLRMRE